MNMYIVSRLIENEASSWSGCNLRIVYLEMLKRQIVIIILHILLFLFRLGGVWFLARNQRKSVSVSSTWPQQSKVTMFRRNIDSRCRYLNKLNIPDAFSHQRQRKRWEEGVLCLVISQLLAFQPVDLGVVGVTKPVGLCLVSVSYGCFAELCREC